MDNLEIRRMVPAAKYWLTALIFAAASLVWGCAVPTQEPAVPPITATAPETTTAVPEVLTTSTEAKATVNETTAAAPVANASATEVIAAPAEATATVTEALVTEPSASDKQFADVISVDVSGAPGAYQFSVGIASPDLGCEQYADWWEVVDEQGQLIYRRILTHSHVGEQPFVRSGGAVEVDADTVVLVRAHMQPAGYGGAAYKGSVQSGFQQVGLSSDFAPELAETPPLPQGCGF